MEGTNSQRAAPGYDAVAQCAECAPTSSYPPPPVIPTPSPSFPHSLPSFPRRRESPPPASNVIFPKIPP